MSDTWAIAEDWRAIPEYEEIYEVSNLGNIRRIGKAAKKGGGYGGGARIGHIRKASMIRNGYLVVQLWKDGKPKQFLVHRLVAMAFIGSIPNGQEVNHKNGNKQDNRITNLEYLTCSENNIHAYQIGLKSRISPFKGGNHPRAKLTYAQIEIIRKEYKPNSRESGSVALARKYGVDHTTLLKAVKAITYKKGLHG